MALLARDWARVGNGGIPGMIRDRRAPSILQEMARKAQRERVKALGLPQTSIVRCAAPPASHPEWEVAYLVSGLIDEDQNVIEHGHVYGYIGNIGHVWAWDGGPVGFKRACGIGARTRERAACHLIAAVTRFS